MYAALLTVHILLLRFFIERLATRSFDLFGDDAEDGLTIGDYLREWLGYFVIGVAIVVVAVPEGLRGHVGDNHCRETQDLSLDHQHHRDRRP